MKRVPTRSAPSGCDALTPVSTRRGLAAQCRRPAWQPATDEELARVHSPEYVERVAAYSAAGGGRMEADTVVCPHSSDVARLAAGAVGDAVQRVLNGEDATALCLVRPPGHHALSTDAMGFCLFNNVAVGARLATQALDVDRVLIVDWDVHHGNGTQAMFWEDPRVAFFSIHRHPFYPGTGTADETGAGDGRGATMNLPTPRGTSAAEFLQAFASRLEEFANRMQPQMVLVSAGFDAHRRDPVGSLGLDAEHFIELSKVVLAVAASHCGGRVVSVLEGGYDPNDLAECVELHLRELMAASPSQAAAG